MGTVLVSGSTEKVSHSAVKQPTRHTLYMLHNSVAMGRGMARFHGINLINIRAIYMIRVSK